ncbi:MAG TPA: hypothetical protein VMH39_13615, partial [Gemmatimonadaceae bacterium]|nr:hypothetical protein [Gemmatimonadaceae bacterium]
LMMAGITIAVAAAAGAVAASSASAAIVALTFTLGTWALDFVAEARGGWIHALSNFTPTAVVKTFEHGELRLATVVVVTVFVVVGLTVAGISLDIGDRLRRRVAEVVLVVVCGGGLAVAASTLHASWDLSENRWNSFPRADEALLRGIAAPLHVTVFLSADDPRLHELETEVLRKLERTMKHVTVDFGATGRTGLTDRSGAYGETWYTMGDSTVRERSVTAAIVLQDIYGIARVRPPPDATNPPYTGYPMGTVPPGIGTVFYAVWPFVLLGTWLGLRRDQNGSRRAG